jgi:cold shock CspA family protein
MAKSKETFNKREKEKKRLKQKQDKQEKMDERKASAKKGKPLEEMMAYIDENGNISSTPPDPSTNKVFTQEDMQISVPKPEEGEAYETVRTGIVSYFNEEKGFGFINDLQTQERVFIHANQLTEQIKEGNRVSFEVEMGPKGPMAMNLKKQ